MKKIIPIAIGAAIASVPVSALAQSMPAWKSYMQTGNAADIVPSAGTDDSVAAWLAKKVDTQNGTMQNPTINQRAITTGPLQMSDIGAASGVAGTDAQKNMQTAPARKSIFIGSARTADMILLEKNADILVNSGRVGLYGHWNGVEALSASDLSALGKYWEPTQSGFGGYGNFQAEGEFGPWTDFSDGSIQKQYGGKLPQEVNVNLYNAGAGNSSYTDTTNSKTYSCYATTDDLTTIKSSVNAMFAVGAKNYAVVSSPNCGTEDFSQPFATGDFWVNVRAMALYGGGITMDTAPGLFFNHQNTSQTGDSNVSTAYPDMIAQMIRWGNQQGLRTTVILPTNAQTGTDQFDDNYLNAAMTEIDYLRANDAIPSEFVVEQYSTTDNGSNAPWGDYVAGSLNRLARYLLGVKTPDGGGTAPQAAGGLPGNQLMTVSTPFTPHVQIPDAMGSLGQQSTDDVHIHAGAIGDTYSNSSKISITLVGESSFLTNVPIVFQGGGGNGNPALEGGGDNWLHLTNPYTSDMTKIGVAFGKDADAPILERGSDGNVVSSTGLDYSGGTTYKPITFYSSGPGATAHPMVAAGTADHFIHISDNFTTDNTLVGLLFNTNDLSTSFGGIVGLSQGAGIGLQGLVIDMQGLTHLKSMTKADILSQTITWDGMLAHDSDDHVPVICENGKWYPIQLGTALSN